MAERLNDVRSSGGRLIAVRTTSLHLLESAALDDGAIRPFEGDTAIFIAGLSLQGSQRPDHQLSFAALDLVHAGQRADEPRRHESGLCPRDRGGVPLLLLWRREPAAAKALAVARFSFSISTTDGAARTGAITMERGTIRTPVFMPVGTAATVKAMRPEEVRASGADIILGNTYHLMLRPGAGAIAKLGGLHKVHGLGAPGILDRQRRLSGDEPERPGQSHGGRRRLCQSSRRVEVICCRRKRSIEAQRLLGSDIVMQFDQLVPTTATRDAQAEAMDRSIRWAKRSREEFDRGGEHAEQGRRCFGIQQGALDEEDPAARIRSTSGRLSQRASTAMRSAGSPSARGRRQCSAASISRPACCRPTSRAI